MNERILLSSWPADRLEAVPECTLCGAPERDKLYDGLTDESFLTATGLWTLWRCRKCRSAWLDPRPDQTSIGFAYARYYTHGSPGHPEKTVSFTQKLGNGYRNFRYGAKMRSAIKLGALAAFAAPVLRGRIDNSFRYLLKVKEGQSARLLDVGCGSGDFLAMAANAGWTTFGTEPDEFSRDRARASGLDVRATISEFAGEPRFDAITLSHVIEHVPDPVRTLRDCRERLKPGGFLYLATPNLESVGHQIYGRHWRGLETPRHLVLFNRNSLTDALAIAGFIRPKYRSSNDALRFIVEQSRRMAAGFDPYDPAAPGIGRFPTPIEKVRAWLPGRNSEFLIVTANRP